MPYPTITVLSLAGLFLPLVVNVRSWRAGESSDRDQRDPDSASATTPADQRDQSCDSATTPADAPSARAGCHPGHPSEGRTAPSQPAEEHPSAFPADQAAAKASPRRPNRLADEPSLYLRMHAHNPVDWYPWGGEALAKAGAENKLIFLSIGYSSCHWCHVMERESFMDQELAEMLNRHFVAIKVDREQRPDLDEIYMTALQIYFQLIRSPQSGGWPLTMFLTPDARPIMGGTYFPPRDKHGYTGLLKVLQLVHDAWQRKPELLRENAGLLTRLAKRQLQEQPADYATRPSLSPDAVPAAGTNRAVLDEVLAALVDQFDPEYGGFGYSAGNPQVPKFPQPSNLVFLLDHVRRGRDQQGHASHGTRQDAGELAGQRQAESMLTTTLEKMAAGGIRDHLGGGFHRYSTDRYWAIPHFEKMLYDNAQLAWLYAETYRLTGREGFRRVVEEMLDFVLREMTGPEGGFYSAIDAETDAEEGRYYVWQRDELTKLLSDEEFRLLADVYGIETEGNFAGRHVLLLRRPLEETARMRQWTEQQLRQRLAPIQEKLLQARSRRPRPATDTKVLCAWNGLMIRGLAGAGGVLENERYVAAAEAAADFVLARLRAPDGRLRRSFAGRPLEGTQTSPRDGGARLSAYLDDYAFLVEGLIALYGVTGNSRWLEEADRLTSLQIDLFWDDRCGGFFFTSRDHERLLARSKHATDSALPSGNAVSVGNLVSLGGLLNKPEYLDRAEQTLRAFAALLAQSPGAMPRMAASLAAFLHVRRPSGNARR